MIWATLGLLVFAAIIVVLPPLLRDAKAPARAERDLAVYRDQLKEIDVDQARGLISSAEAEAARIEIKRRILAAGSEAAAARATSAASRPFAYALAAGVAVVSLGIYLATGRPGLPSRPYDPANERRAQTEAMAAQVDQMVARLEARLKEAPGDAEGWRFLGWSYLQLGRTADAIEALKRAVALDAPNATLRSLLGEAMVRAAAGKVTGEALQVFDEALARDAKDPRARFYKGLAAAQAGRDREALEQWTAIIRDGPADAEWLPAIRAQAQELARKLNLDPKTAVP